MASLPLCVRAVQKSPCSSNPEFSKNGYRYSMLILTFFCYMSYHISRKPFSIVKGELHQNCSKLAPHGFHSHWFGSHSPSLSVAIAPPVSFDYNVGNSSNNATWCDFAPFDQANYKSLFGALDYAFLFPYAIGMFFSGYIAERLPLRYFLSTGMVLCGIFTSMFGFGFYAKVHVFAFYVVAQILNGLCQTTGWPAVVACVGNWFGKERRGLIMGIWNSHTSFGNILGSIIASAFVEDIWGLSFIVPGIMIGCLGIICFFTLIEHPDDFGVQYQPLPSDDKIPDDPSINKVNNNHREATYNSITRDTSDSDETISKSDISSKDEQQAIGFLGALKIPGVIEFSLCLLFAKLVSYTFLFWLPFYIQNTSTRSTAGSGLMSTLFDVGGIFGGILAGVASDHTGGRASTCGVMLIVGAVMMYIFNVYGNVSTAATVSLLLITGGFVNGPYALITTAVSADLGTHPTLKGNSKALSTVTAIIDGTGSIGAAIGPLLTGIISPTGWQNVFWMLIGANVLALLLLTRLIKKEILGWWNGRSTDFRTLNIGDDVDGSLVGSSDA